MEHVVVASGVGFGRPGCILPTVLCPLLLVDNCLVFSVFSARPTRAKGALRAARFLGPRLPRTHISGGKNVSNGCRDVIGSCNEVRSFSTIRGVRHGGGGSSGRTCRSGCARSSLTLLSVRTSGQARRLRQLHRVRRHLQGDTRGNRTVGGSAISLPLPSRSKHVTQDRRQHGRTLTRLSGTLTRTELRNQGKLRPAPSGASASISEPVAAKAIASEGIRIGSGVIRRVTSSTRANRIIGGVGASSSCFRALTRGTPRPGLVGTVVSRGVGTISNSQMQLHLLSSIRVGRAMIPGNSCLCTAVDNFNGRHIGNDIGDVLISSRLIGMDLSLCSASKLRKLCIPNDAFQRATRSITSGTVGDAVGVGGNASKGTFSR